MWGELANFVLLLAFVAIVAAVTEIAFPLDLAAK